MDKRKSIQRHGAEVAARMAKKDSAPAGECHKAGSAPRWFALGGEKVSSPPDYTDGSYTHQLRQGATHERKFAHCKSTGRTSRITERACNVGKRDERFLVGLAVRHSCTNLNPPRPRFSSLGLSGSNEPSGRFRKTRADRAISARSSTTARLDFGGGEQAPKLKERIAASSWRNSRSSCNSVISHPLPCSLGSWLRNVGRGLGQLGRLATQHRPLHVGTKVFATHQTASCLFNSWAAFSGDLGQTAYPLIYSASGHAKRLRQINLAVVLKVSFEVHAITVASLNAKSKPC